MSLKDLVTERMGKEISQKEVDTYLPEAEKKLASIISREGDADGIRRKPGYLAMLLVEIISLNRFTDCWFEASIPV